MTNKKTTIRETCRRRHPLDGIDAQALEGALAQAEREVERLRMTLVIIGAPGNIEDYGNGWAVEMARRAITAK